MWKGRFGGGDDFLPGCVGFAIIDTDFFNVGQDQKDICLDVLGKFFCCQVFIYYSGHSCK